MGELLGCFATIPKYPQQIIVWSNPYLSYCRWFPSIPSVLYRCSDGAEYTERTVAVLHQNLLDKEVSNCYTKLAEISSIPNAK